ncbi:hypothetical protein BJ085DRAFT_31997 [Dimargaris cristalligena]|uniref:Uncharacterized protein n=1 Tax=Dimargaris cristalligena TaxID=215637 RepID=A0A4P9ZNL6_9FUNG|nr:hypothetical protein BJ085DRAFT_31997 [Dimargaris cristalligena]|eukprot:RKP34201.1 hypothetical protein BJ085DRAFT_31997 [Dimargaris cristalligena]
MYLPSPEHPLGPTPHRPFRFPAQQPPASLLLLAPDHPLDAYGRPVLSMATLGEPLCLSSMELNPPDSSETLPVRIHLTETIPAPGGAPLTQQNPRWSLAAFRISGVGSKRKAWTQRLLISSWTPPPNVQDKSHIKYPSDFLSIGVNNAPWTHTRPAPTRLPTS